MPFAKRFLIYSDSFDSAFLILSPLHCALRSIVQYPIDDIKTAPHQFLRLRLIHRRLQHPDNLDFKQITVCLIFVRPQRKQRFDLSFTRFNSRQRGIDKRLILHYIQMPPPSQRRMILDFCLPDIFNVDVHFICFGTTSHLLHFPIISKI